MRRGDRRRNTDGRRFGILLSVFCYLSSVFYVDVLAIDWPWQNGKKERLPEGFTSDHAEERTAASRHLAQRQLLSAQKGTIIHSGPTETHVDLYDENGVATRIDLDLNRDGKVRSDDFLLSGSKRKEPEGGRGQDSRGTVTIPEGFRQEGFWEQIYLARIQDESERLAKKSASLREEIDLIDQIALPGIDRAKRELIKDLFGINDAVLRIEEELVHFGVEVSELEEGEEDRIPEDSPHASTVKKFLLERKQLLLQTAKVKELIEAQEFYRSQQLRRKIELEGQIRNLQFQQNELEQEKKKIMSQTR